MVLRNEMRGWYKVFNRYVENELGYRFYLYTQQMACLPKFDTIINQRILYSKTKFFGSL